MSDASIGTVSISVVPDATGFYRKLDADLSEQADVLGKQLGKEIGDGFTTGIRDGMVKGASEGAAASSGIVEAAGALQGRSFGDAFGRTVQERIASAFRDLPQYDPSINTGEWDREMERIRDDLGTLGGKSIGVDIGDGEALAQVMRLRAELRTLAFNASDIRIRFDSAAAEAKLGRIIAEVEALDVRTRALNSGAFNDILHTGLTNATNSISELDNSRGSDQLAFVRSQLGRLNDMTVGVDISDDAALAKLAKLRAEVSLISQTASSIKLRVDSGAVASQLEAVESRLTGLDMRAQNVLRAEARAEAAARTLMAENAKAEAELSRGGGGGTRPPVDNSNSSSSSGGDNGSKRFNVPLTQGRMTPAEIAAITSALIPLGAAAAIAGGSLVAMGAAGIAAFLGIRQEVAAGTAEGQVYTAYLQVLRNDLQIIETVAAHNVLQPFEQSIFTLNGYMPQVTSEMGQFSSIVGTTGERVLTGFVAGMVQLDPLFLSVGQSTENLAAKFERFATGSGLRNFGVYAQEVLPQARGLLDGVGTAVEHIVESMRGFGFGAISTLRLLVDTLNLIPVGVLQIAVPAITGFFLAFKAANSIQEALAGVKLFGLAAATTGAEVAASTTEVTAATTATTALGTAADTATTKVEASAVATDTATASVAAYGEAAVASATEVEASATASEAAQGAMAATTDVAEGAGGAFAAVGRGLSGAAKFLPIVGVGFALLSTVIEAGARKAAEFTDQENKMAAGLAQGGTAAQKSTEQMAALKVAAENQVSAAAAQEKQYKGTYGAQLNMLSAMNNQKQVESELSTIKKKAAADTAAQNLVDEAALGISKQQATSTAQLLGLTTTQYLTAAAAAKQNIEQGKQQIATWEAEGNYASVFAEKLKGSTADLLTQTAATDSFHASLLQVTDALNKGSGSLDLNTASGVATAQAYDSLFAASNASAQATAQQTQSVEAGTAQWYANRQAMIDNVNANTNLTATAKQNIIDYILETDKVPPNLTTTVTVDDYQAILKIHEVQAAYISAAAQVGLLTIPAAAQGALVGEPAGEIHGPGTGTSDSIIMRVSNGEFISTAESTARNLAALAAGNAGATLVPTEPDYLMAPVSARNVSVGGPSAGQVNNIQIVGVRDEVAAAQAVVRRIRKGNV